MSRKNAPGVVVEQVEWEGKPLLRFEPEEFRPFQMGYGKAKTVLAHLNEIRAFVKEGDEKRAQEQKRQERLTQTLVKTLEEGGFSKDEVIAALKGMDKKNGKTVVRRGPAPGVQRIPPRCKRCRGPHNIALC